MTMQIRRSACASALAVLVAGPAMADCGIGAGNVSILSNDFPAVRALVENAQTCASDSVSVTANMTSEHRDLQVPALTATPAQYSVAVIANQSITPLLDRDLIRPLDDLIDRFGDGLEPTQLIRSGDETMAVAFMANAQHLFYRADLLEQAGVGSPETLSDVLAAAAAIREQGILEHPVALASGAGWDLAQEFVNLFAGHGGRFFLPGTAEPAVNSDEGLAALSALRALTEFSDPDFLTFNSSAAQSLWEAGEVALMMLWGSRAADILSGEGSVEGVAENTVVASAPIIESTGRPATTLWWDGFTIARNISDEDAEASFRAMMHALRPEAVAAKSDLAVWLASGYEPQPSAIGVQASAEGGAAGYPMSPWMGLMQNALGENLAPFLQGSVSAEETLETIEAAYVSAARSQGFLD